MENSAAGPLAECLRKQLAIAWSLAGYHLDGLDTQECLWRPAARGLHVHQRADGSWCADWPEHERYDLGPSSIAWHSWHLIFWWSMALDHCFGPGTLRREDVAWPGDAERVRAEVEQLHARWDARLAAATDEDLASTLPVRWPFHDRPLADLFAWANVELTKSAAEIGCTRFLYAVRS